MAIAIAACDRKLGIGKNGTIPFASDYAFFKKMTKGHVVIMGRKTWESLKVQPLPDRVNIVVSNQMPYGRWYKWHGDTKQLFYVVESLKKAMDYARIGFNDKEHFIIGGAELYRSAFDEGHVSSVLLTKFATDADCDTFFPKSIHELEKMYTKWKVVDIDNDGEIPLMRTYYTNEL